MTTTVDEALCDDDEIPEPARYAADPTWKRITKEQYDECNQLPTATRESDGPGYVDRAFLKGQLIDHNRDGRPLYRAFLSRRFDGVTNYFESDAPMSVVEFQRMYFLAIPHPKPDAEATPLSPSA